MLTLAQVGWRVHFCTIFTSLKLLYQNKKLELQQGSRFLITSCGAWRQDWTSSEGSQLLKCLVFRTIASWRSGSGWSCRQEVMRKRVKGWRRPSAMSLLRLWGAALSNERKPEDSIPVQTALSNVQTKSLKDILGNHSIVRKCHLIYVRDLLSFSSHWLFVSYVQIPLTIKTIYIPLFRWHFQSYKEKSYELLKRENQFFLPNDLLKNAVFLLLKVDHWIRVSLRWLRCLLTFFIIFNLCFIVKWDSVQSLSHVQLLAAP